MEFKADQIFAGRYRLISKIGIGGFSEVWKVADQMADDAIMALKIYAPEKGLDEFGIKQFRREYSVVLNLNHQNLLTARYFDIHDGHPFLIMPFCEGGSVYGRIIEHGTFSEKELAEFLFQIAPALSYLHDNDVVHQDIKPDNILLDGRGNYMLMDFGISGKLRSTLRKSTTTAGAMTVAYAPPEKFKGMGVMTEKSDVFSLGVMMIEMLTSDVPWNGMGGAYLKSHEDIPELPESLSPELNALIKSCLKISTNERCSLSEITNAAKTKLETGVWKFENPNSENSKTERPSGRKTVKMDEAHFTTNETENDRPESRKKKLPIGIIVGTIGIVILTVIIFLLKPWQVDDTSDDPILKEQFIALKSQGDILSEKKDWEVALDKYQEAFALLNDSIVLDSIVAIKKRLAVIDSTEFDNDKSNKNVAAKKQPEEKKSVKNKPVNSPTSKAEEPKKKEPLNNEQVEGEPESPWGEVPVKKELPKPIQELIDNMVYIEPGSCTLGCTNEQKPDCQNDEQVRTVLMKGFNLCKYEVTQAQWQAVMGRSIYEQRDRASKKFKLNGVGAKIPIYYVSYGEVQEFIKKLNEITGKTFRLPTENEWEYAARGGNKSNYYRYAGGNNLNDLAWYKENSMNKCHEVGLKQPNELGLFDICGNVCEWSSDIYENGTISKSMQLHAYRGGSYTFSESFCRVANRSYNVKGNKAVSNVGFRLAL